MDGLSAIYDKNKNTSEGNDIKEDEPLSITSAETNGRIFANQVFPKGAIKTVMERVALADAYDATQALTRLSKAYSTTRKQYYQAAADYNSIQKQRVAYKKSLLMKSLQAIKPLKPKEEQG